MGKVTLHIYDVANGSEKTNKTIVRINNIFSGIGLGGIFHSAVQVYGDDEWSFGFSEEEDSGVFRSPAGKNPMYKYRKSLVLGKTNLNFFEVRQILREFGREWPGESYDLLSKNCNHFCDELCVRLGVRKLPGWVNRFANAGDVAREGAENTASRFRKAKTNILSASKVAFRFLSGATNIVKTDLDSPTNSYRGGSPRAQAAWLRNLYTRSSSCSKSRKLSEVEPPQQIQNKI